MGKFRLEKDVVSVRINPSVPVTHEGNVVRNMVVRSDAEGTPTVLRYNNLIFHVIRRGDRFGVRVKDADSPARRNFTGIETFPIEQGWRLHAIYRLTTRRRKCPSQHLGTRLRGLAGATCSKSRARAIA